MERRALLFVPGISGASMDQSAHGIACRIASALDTGVPDGDRGDRSAEFRAINRGSIAYNDGACAAQFASVERFEGGEAVSRLDIFSLQSIPARIDRSFSTPVWTRLFRVVISLVLSLPRVINMFRSDLGSRARATATGWAIFILAVLSLHFVILVLMLVTSLLQAISVDGMAMPSWIPVWVPRWDLDAWVIPTATAALLFINTVVFPFLPLKFRREVAETASGFMVLLDYLNTIESPSTFHREIVTLIEHLENEVAGYEQYALAGYSFGSVVVLDTVFGKAAQASSQSLGKVQHVITIGCPFDAIAPYWPAHFTNRHDPHRRAPHWANVAVIGDPISSRFKEGTRSTGLRDTDNNTISPAVEIRSEDWGETTSIGFVGHLLINGVRLHGRYWGKENYQPGCWVRLLPWMLEGTVNFPRET